MEELWPSSRQQSRPVAGLERLKLRAAADKKQGTLIATDKRQHCICLQMLSIIYSTTFGITLVMI